MCVQESAGEFRRERWQSQAQVGRRFGWRTGKLSASVLFAFASNEAAAVDPRRYDFR